jgi:2-methylisocitrate lyase-like PEP mutase family enzyme
MLAAAARIARSVDVPVTVDAEAGYGMEPAELVAALRAIGVAGCNLEDTDHGTGRPREAAQHAGWLRAVREAAEAEGYPLVINARIDVFLAAFHAGSAAAQEDLVPEALDRAHAYREAGVDCVYPIALWEADALASFVAGAESPVNALAIANAPSLDRLGEVGVARVSHGGLLHRDSIARFAEMLESLSPTGP